ncbi:ATP-binding protein [Roseofilum casamattae]|uniref:histidine kinase n=1 Tax=Roseofilum casamattae BLCC-M143 TaxID=3022442 RepID=A0ABT7BY02_9CYAN|nr:ATP-binding protein [Roseofilum casamattae]MDJ1184036.1 ATP-binding protein [Roseofilum casamattae BLCC-M143]
MVALLNNVKKAIAHWWSEFTLQTRLMAAATLAVSLIMSGLTFWAVNTIQLDARLHDTRFGQDLGLLLASNVTPFVAENDLSEVAHFSQRFYDSTSNVRYMLYANEEGKIFFGLPFWDSEVQNSLSIERRIQLPENYLTTAQIPLVRQHQTPDGEVTDVFVPLLDDDRYLGVLAIGINPNPTVVTSSNLTRDVTLAVFVSIWSMVILGGVFNALAITKPIKELLAGVTSIAAGNFQQRIDLPLGGELGELIYSFNEMAERLERYEEQNIEELTAEKAKLETLVSTIADGAILLDNDLKIILVNPTARKMFNWEGQAVVSKSILRHVPPPIQVKLTRPLHDILQGNASDSISAAEFRISLHEPTKRTVRILLTTVLSHRSMGEEVLCQNCFYDHEDICISPERSLAKECVLYEHNFKHGMESSTQGNLKGIAMTVQDITREVELNEAKSQFISNVSHELRTPLFNIKGFIETLHEYGEELSEVERQDFLETANHETDRLTRLVNDVLDLSRLESNKTYQFDGVYIGQLIEQTLRTYQLNARDKEIVLLQEIETNLPKAVGNYDLLLQVLTNLVGNSLKFTEAKGKVMIRAYSPHPNKKVVRIEISDTGLGIDPEDQAAIFDRFYRVENRVHTLEGTGLGLSIVRNIIDKHNSSVRLVSEVGVGTTFWFDLAWYEDVLEPEPLESVTSA